MQEERHLQVASKFGARQHAVQQVLQTVGSLEGCHNTYLSSSCLCIAISFSVSWYAASFDIPCCISWYCRRANRFAKGGSKLFRSYGICLSSGLRRYTSHINLSSGQIILGFLRSKILDSGALDLSSDCVCRCSACVLRKLFFACFQVFSVAIVFPLGGGYLEMRPYTDALAKSPHAHHAHPGTEYPWRGTREKRTKEPSRLYPISCSMDPGLIFVSRFEPSRTCGRPCPRSWSGWAITKTNYKQAGCSIFWTTWAYRQRNQDCHVLASRARLVSAWYSEILQCTTFDLLSRLRHQHAMLYQYFPSAHVLAVCVVAVYLVLSSLPVH